MTSPAETAQATTAILESGAVMLGAALVFVTLFRRLKLGATLGYIVAGILIGIAGALIGGQVAPLTGDGMGMGLRAAELAATMMLGVFQQESPWHLATVEYARRWQGEFLPRLRWGRGLEALLLQPRLATSGSAARSRRRRFGRVSVPSCALPLRV